MIDKDHVEQLQSGTVLDSVGNIIGLVGTVYVNDVEQEREPYRSGQELDHD